MKKSSSGLTLFELIAALVVFFMVGLALFNITLFSHANIITANRRAFIQQEASFVVDHLTKNFSRVIGAYGNGIIVNSAQRWVKGRWDRNNNGKPDDDPNGWFGYRYNSLVYQVLYYATTNNSSSNMTGSSDILSNKIVNFVCSPVVNTNYLSLSVTARYAPNGPVSLKNPEITINAYVSMPMMSSP